MTQRVDLQMCQCLFSNDLIHILFSSIQFSQYLHENASYVRPLEEGMLHLFESITEDTVTVLVIFFLNVTSRSGGSTQFNSTFNFEIVFLFQETTVKLKTFSEHLASYVCFLRKILPYQLKRYFPGSMRVGELWVESDLLWS